MTARKIQKLEAELSKVISEIKDAKTHDIMLQRLRRYSTLDRRYTKLFGTHYNPVTANLQDIQWGQYD